MKVGVHKRIKNAPLSAACNVMSHAPPLFKAEIPVEPRRVPWIMGEQNGSSSSLQGGHKIISTLWGGNDVRK